MLHCIAVTKNNKSCPNKICRIYKKNYMYCRKHYMNKPQKIYIKNIKFDRIDSDEYDYIINNINNLINNQITLQHIKRLLRERRENINKLKLEQKIIQEKLKYQEIIKNKQIETEIINNIKECKCCYDNNLDLDNLICCDKITSRNKHKICKECFSRYIKLQLESTDIDMHCMFNKYDNCNGVYNNDIIKSILTDEEYSKYIDLKEIYEIKKLAQYIKNYKICPQCNKYGIEVDVKEKTSILCRKCNKSWCNLCNKEYHIDDCYKLKLDTFKDVNDKTIYINNILAELETKALMHICPKCNTKIIKDGGCNLISCTNCNTYSCYICNIQIFEKEHTYYHHFNHHPLNDSNSKCILWTDNDKYNKYEIKIKNNKIIESFDHLLSVNNLEEKQLIYNEIKKNYINNNIITNIKKLGRKHHVEDNRCMIS